MLSDGYVKYDEAEVRRSAIMQDFRDNEKTNRVRLAAILDFITAKFVKVYPCVRNYFFVLYSWSSYFAFFGVK